MGRGRAKAKQVKVARQLKYSGGGTDLDRLRAELGVDSGEHGANGESAYADLGDRYSADDDSDHAPDDDDEDGKTTRTTRTTGATAPMVSSVSPDRPARSGL